MPSSMLHTVNTVRFENLPASDKVVVKFVQDGGSAYTVVLTVAQMLELGTCLRGLSAHPEKSTETVINWTNKKAERRTRGS